MTLSYPPPFQDLATLAAHCCMSEHTIENLVKAGSFPQPRRNKCGKRLWVWKEVEAWLAAFNKVRAEVGGIKTDEQQRYAMNEALDAADKVRKGDQR